MSSSLVWRRGRKLKRADHVHGWWWEAVLGDDEHGQWAAQPALAPTFLRDGTVFRMADAVIRCYPRHEWWVATFYGSGRGVTFVRPSGGVDERLNPNAIYVDISTPPEWTESGISFVDLTVDVVKRYDETVVVLDEDEVDEEARKWATPTGQRAQARRSRARVEGLMTAGTGVFGGVAESWRERFVGCRQRG